MTDPVVVLEAGKGGEVFQGGLQVQLDEGLVDRVLELGKSSRGAWSSRQIRLLGLPGLGSGKLQKGWRHDLPGRWVEMEKLERFVALRDAHLRRKHRKA